MIDFGRIPSLLKIFLMEGLVMLTWGSLYANLRQGGWADSVLFLVGASVAGLLAITSLVHGMWMPAVIADSYGMPRYVQRNPWRPRNWLIAQDGWAEVDQGPGVSSGNYLFLTSHPSYVFIDLFAVGVAYLMMRAEKWAGFDLGTFIHSRDQAWLALSLLFPVLRLFLWFGLGRRPTDRHAEVVSGAWKPVATLYCLLIPLVVAPTAWFATEDTRLSRGSPLVTATSLSGGLQRHPELLDRYVQVQGIQVSEPYCWNAPETGEAMMNHVTLILDMGEGGTVVVKASGASRDDLVRRAQNNLNKPLQVGGLLLPWDAIGQRVVRTAQPLPPPPPPGRVLLMMESPGAVQWDVDHKKP